MFSYRFISLPRPRSSRTPEQQQTSAKGDFINLPIEWMAFSWHFSFVIIIIIFVLVCFVLPFLVLATYRFEDLANENKYPFVVCLLFAHETNQKQEVIKKSKLNWIAKTIYRVSSDTRHTGTNTSAIRSITFWGFAWFFILRSSYKVYDDLLWIHLRFNVERNGIEYEIWIRRIANVKRGSKVLRSAWWHWWHSIYPPTNKLRACSKDGGKIEAQVNK